MKRNFSNFLLAATVLLSTSFAGQAAEQFTLDDHHTYVLWNINHLGFSTQVGKWYAKGFVVLDKEHPETSKVEATIAVDTISTGLPELDEHLKGPLFFDTKKFPTATFISNKVDVLSDTSAKVEGLLTLHGVSKAVTLMVKLNKMGKDPINDRMTAGFSATTQIKRSDFNMNSLLPSVGDDVSIEIGAEAYKSNP
ncbi:TPA: polyisoprenoid-binding protein [Legionella pneumophila]|nr:polyisoprenoid-binding protein [Legionella pneumophila]